MPVIAITLAVFIALQLMFATVLRPNLLPSTTEAMPINAATLSHGHGVGQVAGANGPLEVFGLEPAGAWVLSSTDIENSSGQNVLGSQVNSCFSSSQTVGDCLAPYDLHVDYTYQPAGNFWPLQWTETGIYLALAGLASSACFWRIRRHRD